MDLNELQTHWNEFGRLDPLYAILTEPGKEDNAWDIDEFFARGVTEIDDLMSYLRSLGLSVKSERALDFGCGVGRLTQALSRHFEEVRGVDIAPSMIALANTYNHDQSRCRYYLNSCSDLQIFESETFDFIYSNITLQHMAPEYSVNYIREFLRVLSAEGLLVFQLLTGNMTKRSSSARSLLKDLAPASLLTLYRKLRYGGLKPLMQIYGVDPDLVAQVLQEGNGIILDVQREAAAEADLISQRYVVTKPGRSGKTIESNHIDDGSSLNHL